MFVIVAGMDLHKNVVLFIYLFPNEEKKNTKILN